MSLNETQQIVKRPERNKATNLLTDRVMVVRRLCGELGPWTMARSGLAAVQLSGNVHRSARENWRCSCDFRKSPHRPLNIGPSLPRTSP